MVVRARFGSNATYWSGRGLRPVLPAIIVILTTTTGATLAAACAELRIGSSRFGETAHERTVRHGWQGWADRGAPELCLGGYFFYQQSGASIIFTNSRSFFFRSQAVRFHTLW